MEQYQNHFSALLWPHLDVEWLGLLSMFNYVNVLCFVALRIHFCLDDMNSRPKYDFFSL